MTVKPSLSPELPTDLAKNRLPQHVAVIMDGNGRWAKNRGLPRIMGHQRGVDALKDLLRCCRDWGIPALTAYAFSTENWGRPLEEVEFLMTLFERVLRRELEEMMQENVKIRFIGNLSALPESLRREIAKSQAETISKSIVGKTAQTISSKEKSSLDKDRLFVSCVLVIRQRTNNATNKIDKKKPRKIEIGVSHHFF